MAPMRDYVEWHRHYDDPASSLSWRLTAVQGHIHDALDRLLGPVSVLSLCSGDGRDVFGVIAERPADAPRVSATLVEAHPTIAAHAREAAKEVGLAHCEVREADAGCTASLGGAAPANIVLLVGIFGNISDEDLQRTVRAAPQLCCPGATLVWSRGRENRDLNDRIRVWFEQAGFAETAYETLDSGSKPAVGACVYEGPAVPLEPAEQLFTFVR